MLNFVNKGQMLLPEKKSEYKEKINSRITENISRLCNKITKGEKKINVFEKLSPKANRYLWTLGHNTQIYAHDVFKL